MAEFATVMEQWTRMCTTYDKCRDCPLLNTKKDDPRNFCPLVNHKCADGNWLKRDPEQIEKIVTEWAAEHPNVVYPTWGEWLKDHYFDVTDIVSVTIDLDKPISANIASRLGIKPRE